MAAGIAHRNPAPAKAMEAAAQAEIPVLKRRLGVLDTIVTLAPLLGLLGTVVGMIGSFDVMADVGIGQPHAVTGGVAEALIATATGLLIAILTLVSYNYFTARAEREMDQMEHFSSSLELQLHVQAGNTDAHSTPQHKKARIEIIPMIDTIFFLLVFFMISTLSMTQFKGMPVNLPKAASGQQAPAESAAITINKEHQIFLDKQPVEKTSLADRLGGLIAKNPELLVVINADDGVEHGHVVEVMDIARSANVAKMAIAVKPKEQKK